MTFWDFANAHPYATIALAFMLLLIVDSIGTDIVRAIAACRGATIPPTRIGTNRQKESDSHVAP